jgi:hypothetical protein
MSIVLIFFPYLSGYVNVSFFLIESVICYLSSACHASPVGPADRTGVESMKYSTGVLALCSVGSPWITISR